MPYLADHTACLLSLVASGGLVQLLQDADEVSLEHVSVLLHLIRGLGRADLDGHAEK
jgi:hypothetical protein